MDFWKNGLMILLLPLLLSGCRTPDNGTPQWVTNPKSTYPESTYLVAVGEGDTRRAAENAAAANLARIFETQIKSEERLSEKTRETSTDFERTTKFDTDVNILSAQTLFNIQHAESWIDASRRVHAVAYIDRRETAAIYRDKIKEKTTRVNYLDAHADQADDVLMRYARLRAAVRIADEAQALLTQLKVIHPPSVPDTTPGYTVDRLRKELADAAKQIRVEISIGNDRQETVRSSLAESVTGQGFVLGKPAILSVEGTVHIDDTATRAADLIFVRYRLNLTISDGNGTTLLSFSEQGREAHINADEAGLRAVRTLKNDAGSSLQQRLGEYFDGLVDRKKTRMP